MGSGSRTREPAAVDPAEVFVQYRPNRRRRVRFLVVLGVGLLVLTILGSVRTTVFSPEAAVQAYFQALADRDAAAALETLADEPTGDRGLLTAAVLASDDYTPPTDVAVQDTAVDGGEATVTVAFTVGEERHATPLTLRRGEGFWDTFQHWRLTDGTGELQLGQVPGAVTVNGERIEAGDPGGRRVLPALFGGYRVQLPDDDPLWEPQALAVVVGPEDSPPVALPLVARAEVRAEVERQIAVALDECATIAEVRPPGCPFRARAVIGVVEMAWEITRYPEVRLTPDAGDTGQVRMRVETAEAGEAVAAGTTEFLTNVDTFEYVDTFTVPGVVTYSGGVLRYVPEW